MRWLVLVFFVSTLLSQVTLSEEEAKNKFDMLMSKGIGKFISKPVKNPIAKKWVKNQLILKKQGLR